MEQKEVVSYLILLLLYSISLLYKGTLYSCAYDALIRLKVFKTLQLSEFTGYLPSDDKTDLCAPTENDDIYTHKRIQGQVSDGNAYAMGGIAGHAG